MLKNRLWLTPLVVSVTMSAESRSMPPTHTCHPSRDARLLAVYQRGLDATPETCASELGTALGQCLERAQAAFPELMFSDEVVVEHLAHMRKASSSHELLGILGGPHVGELYLAIACGHGSEAGLDRLEHDYFTPLLDTLTRIKACQDASIRDEVVQRLRERLLVARPGRCEPGILTYGGRGPLAAWLRVVAVREALGMQRKHRRESPAGSTLDVLPDAAAGPELSLLKQHYREAFRAAFHSAVATLTAEQRNTLRHYYLHGMSIDRLARILNIHRATVARRLARLRGMLLERTRHQLQSCHGVPDDAFTSVVRLIASRFDASVRRVLGDDQRQVSD